MTSRSRSSKPIEEESKNAIRPIHTIDSVIRDDPSNKKEKLVRVQSEEKSSTPATKDSDINDISHINVSYGRNDTGTLKAAGAVIPNPLKEVRYSLPKKRTSSKEIRDDSSSKKENAFRDYSENKSPAQASKTSETKEANHVNVNFNANDVGILTGDVVGSNSPNRYQSILHENGATTDRMTTWNAKEHVLPQDEQILVKSIRHLSSCYSFPRNKVLLRLAHDCLKRRGIENEPSLRAAWINSFLSRNKNILLMENNIHEDKVNATYKNKTNFNHFYDRLSLSLKKFKFPREQILKLA